MLSLNRYGNKSRGQGRGSTSRVDSGWGGRTFNAVRVVRVDMVHRVMRRTILVRMRVRGVVGRGHHAWRVSGVGDTLAWRRYGSRCREDALQEEMKKQKMVRKK
jgi:hypothetical protein